MMRVARLGERVVVLDEGGNWRGCGTAWKLAEDGHEVTLVTPDPLVGKELQRAAADFPLRRALATLGVVFRTETALSAWTNEGAETLDLLTGRQGFVVADSLVLATVNIVGQHPCRHATSRGARPLPPLAMRQRPGRRPTPSSREERSRFRSDASLRFCDADLAAATTCDPIETFFEPCLVNLLSGSSW